MRWIVVLAIWESPVLWKRELSFLEAFGLSILEQTLSRALEEYLVVRYSKIRIDLVLRHLVVDETLLSIPPRQIFNNSLLNLSQ